MPPFPNTQDEDWVIPPFLWRWLSSRWTLCFILWCICIGTAIQRFDHARTMFRTETSTDPAMAQWVRPSGNAGHTEIDFGGQWLMGRMVLEGHADELYNRNRLWEVSWFGYPIADEPPLIRDHVFPAANRPAERDDRHTRHDTENLLLWMVGNDHDAPERQQLGPIAALPFATNLVWSNPFTQAGFLLAAEQQITPELIAAVNQPSIGGPLYPPIHGFFYAPLALLDPPTAYWWLQLLFVLITFPAGYAVKVLSRNTIWWPVATTLILLFPGYRAGLDLGQNPALTVSLLLIGWALAVRGRDRLGGLVWGLLAFKPVWAVTFLLVPLLMRRWRFCLTMAGTGLALILMTLPFTGVRVWQDWLTVGSEASAVYQVNKNWIELSRDLHGIPRRFLIDYDIVSEQERLRSASARLANTLGWLLWGAVAVTTTVLYLLCANRRKHTGLGAGFLFLGAWLCCYRFMYYDVLIAVVGIFILLAERNLWWRNAGFTLTPLPREPLLPEDPRPLPHLTPPPPEPLSRNGLITVNSFLLTMLFLLLILENWGLGLAPEATVRVNGWNWTATQPNGSTELKTATVAMTVSYYQPWDTVLILILWFWAGFRLLLSGEPDETVSDTA
ncbi:MAG: DUF2029 domain-containing protein [Bacteroidales bacterium]|nr:DUF2029 domain-containing protein [Bacteroidales bacterium]